jgi:hypothetical protein
MNDETTNTILENRRQIKILEEDVCYAQLNNRPSDVIETLEGRIRFLRAQLTALEAVNPGVA